MLNDGIQIDLSRIRKKVTHYGEKIDIFVGENDDKVIK